MVADASKAVAAVVFTFLLLAPVVTPLAEAQGTPSVSEATKDPAAEAAALLAPFRALPRDAPLTQILAAAMLLEGERANAVAKLYRYEAPETGSAPLADALTAYGRVLGIQEAPGFAEARTRASLLPEGLQKNVALLLFAMADAESLLRGGAVRPEVAATRDSLGLSSRDTAALVVASAIDQAKPGLAAWSRLLAELKTLQGDKPTARDTAQALAASDNPLAAAVSLAGSPLGFEDLRAHVATVDADLVSEINILYRFLGVGLSPELAEALYMHLSSMDPLVVEHVARILWAENRASILREQVFINAAARSPVPVDPEVLEALLRSPNPDASLLSGSAGTSVFTPDEEGTLGFASGLVVAAMDLARDGLAPLSQPRTQSHSTQCRPVALANLTFRFCDEHNDILFKDPLNLVIVSGQGSTTYGPEYTIPGLVESARVSADRRELRNLTSDALNQSNRTLGTDPRLCVRGTSTCAGTTLLGLYNTSQLSITEGYNNDRLGRVNTTYSVGEQGNLLNLTGVSYQVLTLDLGGNDVYRNNAGGSDPLRFNGRTIDQNTGRNLSIVFEACRSINRGCDESIVFPLGINDRQCSQTAGARDDADRCGTTETGTKERPSDYDLYLYNFGVRLAPTVVPNPLPIAAVALDLGGADRYESTSNWTQGAATLGGIGILIDYDSSGSNGDTFIARSNSTAAARDGGFALLANLDTGRDTYIGVDGVQAVTGAFIPFEDSKPGDECRFRYGGTPSVAMLIDLGGNDQYTASCMAQAVATPGSNAVLWDRAGDDRYVAKFHAQAVVAGGDRALLLDEAGSDTYTLTEGYAKDWIRGETIRGQGYRLPMMVSGGVFAASANLVDLAGGAKDLRPRETPVNTYYGSDIRVREWSGSGSAILVEGGRVPSFGGRGMLLEVEDLRVNSYHDVPDWSILGIGDGSTNVYERNFTLLIDLGGNDHYKNNGGAIWTNPFEREDPNPQNSAKGNTTDSAPNRLPMNSNSGSGGLGYTFGPTRGERVAILLDIDTRNLGPRDENDVYEATFPIRKDQAFGFAQASAGEDCLSFLVDVAGSDRYLSNRRAQAHVLGTGVAVLADYSGNDVYEAGNSSQGYAGPGVSAGSTAESGIAVLFDAAGDDRYTAPSLAQGFAERGRGLLIDQIGNDVYTLTGEAWDDELKRVKGPGLSGGFGQGAASAVDPANVNGMQQPATRPMGLLFDAGGRDTYRTNSTYSHGFVYQADLALSTPAEGANTNGLKYGVAILADDGDDTDTYSPPRTSLAFGWSAPKRNDNYWTPNPIYKDNPQTNSREETAFDRNFVALGLDNLDKALNKFAADMAFAAGGTGQRGVPSTSPVKEAPGQTAARASAPTVRLSFSYPNGTTPADGVFEQTVRITATITQGGAAAVAPPGSFVSFFAGPESRLRSLIGNATITGSVATLDFNTTSVRRTSFGSEAIAPDGLVDVVAYAYMGAASEAAQGRNADSEARSYYVGVGQAKFAVNNAPFIVDWKVPAFNPQGVRSVSNLSFRFSEPLGVPATVKVTTAGGLARTLTTVFSAPGPNCPQGFGGCHVASWDGKMGDLTMGPGQYPIRVTTKDETGRSVTNTSLSPIVIDTGLPRPVTVLGGEPYRNITNTPRNNSPDDSGAVRNHTFRFNATDVAGGTGVAAIEITLQSRNATTTTNVTTTYLTSDRLAANERVPLRTLVVNGTRYEYVLRAIDGAGNPSAPVYMNVTADFAAPQTEAYLDADRQATKVINVRFRDLAGTNDVAAWILQYQRQDNSTWHNVPIPGKASKWYQVNATDAALVNARSVPFDTATLVPPLRENETLSFRSIAVDRAGNREQKGGADFASAVDPFAAAVRALEVVPQLTSAELRWETDRGIVESRLKVTMPTGVKELSSNRTGRAHFFTVTNLHPDTSYPYTLTVKTFQGIVTTVSGTLKTLPSLGVVLLNPDPEAEENILTSQSVIRWRSGAVPFREGGDPQVDWNVSLRVDDGPWVELGRGFYVEAKPISVGSLHELADFNIRGFNDTKNAFVKVSLRNKFQTNVSIAKVVFDRSPPDVTLKTEGTLNVSGWYTSPVALTFKATDSASSIRHIKFTVDGINHTYEGKAFLVGDGVHEITYYAQNSAGLNSKLKTLTLKVDTKAPEGTLRIDGASETTGRREIRLLVAGKDPEGGAGLDAARLYEEDLNNFGPWTPFRKASEIRMEWTLGGKGATRVMVAEVRDKAGNIDRATLRLTYDAIAPRLLEAPVVGDVGYTSVRLTWQTNEPSLTRVFYFPSALEGSEDTTAVESIYEGNGFVTSHEAVITDLLPNVAYRFEIGTEDFLTNADRPALGVGRFTTLSDTEMPGSVEALEATVLPNGHVVLRWPPATDNVAIASYLVERAPAAGGAYVGVGETRSTSFRDERAPAGEVFRYRVIAVDAQGNRGLPSEAVPVAVTTAPVLDFPAVTPSQGDAGSTVFKFTICYLDADGGPTANVTLVLDGKEYAMAEAPTNVCTNGFTAYQYETTLKESGLATGLTAWHVLADDSEHSVRYPLKGDLPGPVVQNAGFASAVDGVPAFGFGGWRGVVSGGVFLVILAVAVAVVLRRRNA
ncbi:MAG TPA: hypothetical protein VNZ52_11440 [Candidatus Thermoplasmatota archaeon]|nr:hypothetical protein [Candidatus Thermoplasmatota archaeon]